jgi:DNA polymerase-3 subunit gamma/tau
LVGTVSSDILEEVMRAVSANSSPDVLRIVDKLLVEGQSAQHFARQMVRFLRNVLVAKVAGSDSHILQISTDERERIARVADAFSEEELARFLQIMLRTHSELSYKQEQRFHLELGLLKLVHAQRLLPLEELLSGEPVKTTGIAPTRGGSSSLPAPRVAPSPSSRPASTHSPEAATARSAPASPFAKPSPFESDRNRKSEMKSDVPQQAHALSVGAATAVAVEPAPPSAAAPEPEITLDILRGAVLDALESSGQQMLAHNLEQGEWSVRGTEITVKVGLSQVLIDVALGEAPRRVIHNALAKAAGKPLRFKMENGGAGFTAKSAAPRPANSSGNGGSARSRAMSDPVVKQMQETFGAEIRTVIDLKDRS